MGVVIGVMHSVVWSYINHCIIKPNWYTRICESQMGKWLLLRDTSNVDNIVMFEYTNVRRYNNDGGGGSVGFDSKKRS